MGLRYRKRIKILGGVYLNLSKNGISSLSLRAGWLSYNLGKKGNRFTAGLHGSGLAYSLYLPNKKGTTVRKKMSAPSRTSHKNAFASSSKSEFYEHNGVAYGSYYEYITAIDNDKKSRFDFFANLEDYLNGFPESIWSSLDEMPGLIGNELLFQTAEQLADHKSLALQGSIDSTRILLPVFLFECYPRLYEDSTIDLIVGDDGSLFVYLHLPAIEHFHEAYPESDEISIGKTYRETTLGIASAIIYGTFICFPAIHNIRILGLVQNEDSRIPLLESYSTRDTFNNNRVADFSYVGNLELIKRAADILVLNVKKSCLHEITSISEESLRCLDMLEAALGAEEPPRDENPERSFLEGKMQTLKVLKSFYFGPSKASGRAISGSEIQCEIILYNENKMEINYTGPTGPGQITLASNDGVSYTGCDSDGLDYATNVRIFKDGKGATLVYGAYKYVYDKGTLKETSESGYWLFVCSG